jgi:transcriptional regulator with XRE-family HTH domain
MASNIPRGAVGRLEGMLHNGCMRKPRANPKPKRRETFIKAWRKFRGLSLIAAVERLALETDIELSDSQLSRIERGEQPYNQDLLEALAVTYRCDPQDLIMRDPSSPEAIWSIWEQLAQPERNQLVEIGKTFKKAG